MVGSCFSFEALSTWSLSLFESRCGGMLASIWTTGMPEGKSNFASDVDWMYGFINIVNVIFFVPIVFALVYFSIRFRKPPGAKAESDVSHNTPLEIVWTVIPMIIVVFMFFIGFRDYNKMLAAPADAYTIHVKAQQWSWGFDYPNGMHTDYDKGALDKDNNRWAPTDPDQGLHLPPGVPIRMMMTSDDVLHSFFIPEFRVKQDVVPGKISSVWFTPDTPLGDEPDMYWLLCTEYCGTSHSEMLSAVYVHPTWDSFLAWQVRASSWRDEQSWEERGEILSRRKGCAQCHSVVANAKGAWTGPTWYGLWGKTAKEHAVITRGTKVREEIAVTGEGGEAYLLESMRDPFAKLAEGFGEVMPIKRLSEEEILYLIAYIKSIGKKE